MPPHACVTHLLPMIPFRGASAELHALSFASSEDLLGGMPSPWYGFDPQP